MELDHLAIAERAVLEGERRITCEEQMVADLIRAGYDTTLACATLVALRRMQAEHVRNRDLLLEILEQHGCTIVGPCDPTQQPGERFRARNCNRHP